MRGIRMTRRTLRTLAFYSWRSLLAISVDSGLQLLADSNIALSVVTKPQHAATVAGLQIFLLAVISHIRRPEGHALNWFSDASSVSCVADVE
jgi:hypothetical protein